MSIATHCAMLMNGGERVAFDKKPQMVTDGAIFMMSVEGTNAGAVESGKKSLYRTDNVQVDISTVESSVDDRRRSLAAETSPEIAFNTVFYVSHEGLIEIRSGTPSLAIQARRALLMIDGFRTAADLSLRLRGGEAEKILRDLEARNLIGRIQGNEIESANQERSEKKLSAARLEEIKQTIVRDLRERLGKPANFVLNDVLATIGRCENALELRAALRDAGDVLVIELGEAGVIGHIRAIGKNVMELIAESD